METILKEKSKKIKDRLAKNKIKQFEIFIETKHGTNLEVKNGKRDVHENKRGLGYGLRILDNDQMAFSYGSDFSDAAIDFVIHQCQQSIPFLKADKCHVFAKAQKYPKGPILCDDKFDQISVNEKLDFLIQVEQDALNSDKRIKKVIYTSLDDEYESTYLENSHGLSCFQDKSVFCASVGAQAMDGDDSEIAYEMDSQILFSDLGNIDIAKIAGQHAASLLNGKPIPNYKGPIILRNDVMVEFLEILSPSFLGDNVFKFNSKLVDKIGHKMYSDQITIFDDGLLKNGMGSGTFDAEGTAKQTTVLVNAGIVHNFLYDLYWGGRVHKPSTGNSHRQDITSVPGLEYNNFYINSGTTKFDDMIDRLKDGVVVTDVIGMHNAEETSGEFSVGIQGVMFKNGQIDHAIRSNVLTGNIHDLLANVVDVGSDLKFYGSLGSPSLLVDHMEISGE